MNEPKHIDGWVEVFQSGIDYEADLVRDRLDDSGIEAVIMRKKDRSFSLTQGSMSRIHVMVPEARQEEAISLLSAEVPSGEELDRIALAADPENPSKEVVRDQDERAEANADNGTGEVK
ncbi:MAG: DUF2007 domain-containing protein [Bacteroidetes bacterium]|nr:DUF2007 domain-containing protein [Bacteroidota bacterium]MDA1334187.1 DUF2007 domain-containing protein [Bacteroidota bacterium]